jgi:NAD(P)-dependent dehydrogenase (short-subunit alcohol dehydrogenase family)
MNILVTGAAGSVGRGVVAYLLERGHSVRALDRHFETPLDGVECVVADITNFADLREQARGMQGIIHLAAYAYPGAAPGTEIFRVNCSGTYNMFEAAAAEGIRRVTCASSINALGFNFGVKSFPIEYFPVDEDHPTCTTDPYSFSKQVTEEIARYYWRRDGISSTCLRMPWVYTMTPEMEEMVKGFVAQTALANLQTLPAAEQREKLAGYLAELEKYRQSRAAEQPFDRDAHHHEEPEDDGLMVFFGYTDFWAIVSVVDAAQAFEKSLTADFEGSHPLFISERENSAGMDAEDLLRLFYPEVSARRADLPGRASLLSYAKAQRLIGYEPQHLVRPGG